MSAVDTARGDAIRDALIGGILEFLSGQDLLTLRDIRRGLEDEIDAAGPQALVDLKASLTMDAGWAYHPPDPLVRRIHHLLANRFLSAGSDIMEAAVLPAFAGQPLIIVANHLSYADANVIEVLLSRSIGAEMAGRLTATAGPKVFTERRRRFSSLCFGTIKVPQSADVSSEEAVLTPREVAKAARQSIEAARARLASGDALLLFGEGTRSRTGEMQPMLAGVARYLEGTDAWILPAGLEGSGELFPIGNPELRPARVLMHVGVPLRAADLCVKAGGDRRLVMDTLGLAIAELLPERRRGVYREAREFAAAGALLARCRAATLESGGAGHR